MRITYKRITKGERNGKHSETENSIWGECGWVIERTFGWLNRYRRLAKDYERSVESSEAMIQIAMIRLMLARLAHKRQAQQQQCPVLEAQYALAA
jgi:transposase